MDKIELIRKMIESDTNNYFAWYLLGMEYKERLLYSQALQAFSEALKSGDEELSKNIFMELSALNQVYAQKDNAKDLEKQESGIVEDTTNSDEYIKVSTDSGERAEDSLDSDEYREAFLDSDEYTGDSSNSDDNIGNSSEFEENIDTPSDSNESTDDAADSEEYKRDKVISLEQMKIEQQDNRITLKVIDGGKYMSYPVEEEKSGQIDFKDVGGLDEVKDIIRMKIIKPFSSPMIFQKFKKKIGGGILLYGPPGCGKTFIAKATAGECNASFIPVYITDILDPYLGVSEQNIKDIFMQARAKKPCILFFDEIDTIGYNRAKLNSEHLRPAIDQLLTEIEGIDSNTDKLLIIGATNMPWDVDPAFKRPGRFDRTVFVQPPDIMARAAIFQIKLKDKPSEHVDYMKLAEQTELYSGADIENVVELATEYVIDDILSSGKERPLMMKDLTAAIKATKPSTLEWLKTIKNYVKYANQSGLYDDVEKFLKKYKSLELF